MRVGEASEGDDVGRIAKCEGGSDCDTGMLGIEGLPERIGEGCLLGIGGHALFFHPAMALGYNPPTPEISDFMGPVTILRQENVYERCHCGGRAGLQGLD